MAKTSRQARTSAVHGMHADTTRLIRRISSSGTQVLFVQMKSSKDAERRAEALRRARQHGHVQFKELIQKADRIYVRVR